MLAQYLQVPSEPLRFTVCSYNRVATRNKRGLIGQNSAGPVVLGQDSVTPRWSNIKWVAEWALKGINLGATVADNDDDKVIYMNDFLDSSACSLLDVENTPVAASKWTCKLQ
jgi:hypothetical protein